MQSTLKNTMKNILTLLKLLTLCCATVHANESHSADVVIIGGTPAGVAAAIAAARAIDIPVVGIDFIVQSPAEPDYVFIEANERPGLANHEPQPTAERFIDLLFPMSIPAPMREQGG